MDLNLLRGIITALSLLCFIGIVMWAYRPRNRARFEQDARIPLDDGAKEPAKEPSKEPNNHG
jgi:cytochrome c oxidase cbb3-type subunit IV